MYECYDRETLYGEVWKEPMTVVSKRYGVSDVALAKTCDKLKVPRPAAGYWAKKAVGKDAPQTELPTFDAPPKITIQKQTRPPEEERIVPEAFARANEMVAREALDDMRISVPLRITVEHPYVRNTRVLLEKRKGNTYSRDFGRVHAGGGEAFEVNIGPDSINRTLRILQSLCDAFEKRGIRLVPVGKEERYRSIEAQVFEEHIGFSIFETANKTKLLVKKDYSYTDYEYIPSGKLTIQIKAHYSESTCRTKWTDTEKKPIETRLNEFISSLYLSAAWEKEYAERRRRRDEEWKRCEEHRIEQLRLQRLDAIRIQNFVQGANDWLLHRDLTAYLHAVKKDLADKNWSETDHADIFAWVTWAEQFLEKTAPVINTHTIYAVKDPEPWRIR